MTDEPLGARVILTDIRRLIPIRLSGSRLASWLPPVDRREFWAIQVLVALIAALHFAIEYQHFLDEHSPIYLLPTTLFLIPVIYAAVTFGRRGAVLTAIWAAVLVAPNVVVLHDATEGLGEFVQVAWITVVAVFVGGRVDRERSARREAEYREERQRDSEARYRAIVNNVGEPIVVLDAHERVLEANDAASELLGQAGSDLRGKRLRGDAGDVIRGLLRTAGQPAPPVLIQLGRPQRWYTPVVTQSSDPRGNPTTQVLLNDVTASTERERGLEGITRQTLATREEERRRISRELHDGPLQSLVTLWRDLDELSARAEEPERERLLDARAKTEAVADELRRFSRDLRPSVLDDLGIAAALRAEASRVAEEPGIAVRVDTAGKPRRLGPEVELTLLRIAQEALRNTARHARASVAVVTLEFGPPGVRLRIADDGIGLDPMPEQSELLGSGHLGVIGMRERARMIGGSVLLQQAALGGLEVSVDIPEASIKRDA